MNFKKNVIVFVLAVFSVCHGVAQDFPFALDKTWDSVMLGASAVFAGGGYLWSKKADLPEFSSRSVDIDDVNPLDRHFARGYNENLDLVSDVGLVSVLAGVPLAFYGYKMYDGDLSFSNGITLAAMYAESLLFVQGAKYTAKVLVHRVRPYMYFDGVPDDWEDDNGFQFSFFSGHASTVFMTAGFMTYTFSKIYPDSELKIPVIVTSYSLAACVSLLRVASGCHFVSDIAVGALFGTLVGYGIPMIHTRFAEKKIHEKGDVAIMPSASGISFRMYL